MKYVLAGLILLFLNYSEYRDIKPSLTSLVKQTEDVIPKPKVKYTINEDTDIKLDGKPAKFEDIPRDAEIAVMVTSGSTVLKIEFITPKKPKPPK